MDKPLISYLKVAAIGIAAFVVCACARLSQSGALSLSEPRLGDPPATRSFDGEMTAASTESWRMAELEDALAQLDVNIAGLRRALDVMAALSEASGDPAAVQPMLGTGAGLLYAIAPELTRASALFHEADLASGTSRASMAVPADALVFERVSPFFGSSDSVVRLTGDGMSGEAAIDALCVELSALTGPCGVSAPVRAYR